MRARAFVETQMGEEDEESFGIFKSIQPRKACRREFKVLILIDVWSEELK